MCLLFPMLCRFCYTKLWFPLNFVCFIKFIFDLRIVHYKKLLTDIFITSYLVSRESACKNIFLKWENFEFCSSPFLLLTHTDSDLVSKEHIDAEEMFIPLCKGELIWVERSNSIEQPEHTTVCSTGYSTCAPLITDCGDVWVTLFSSDASMDFFLPTKTPQDETIFLQNFMFSDFFSIFSNFPWVGEIEEHVAGGQDLTSFLLSEMVRVYLEYW